jgi:hypothetical protein
MGQGKGKRASNVEGLVAGADVCQNICAETSPDGSQLIGFELKASHDPEVSSTATKGPVEVWVRFIVDVCD